MIKKERLFIMQSDVLVQGNKAKIGKSLAEVLNKDGGTLFASSDDEEDPASALGGSRISIRSRVNPPCRALVTSPPKKPNGFPEETLEPHRLLHTAAT